MAKLAIADCFIDEYVHSLKLKNFCYEHGMKVSENKADLFKQVVKYAGENETSECYKETYNWFLEAIKAGRKEFCLERIYIPDEILEDIQQILLSKFEDCPQQDILSYKAKEEFDLADWKIENNSKGMISKIMLLFCRLVLDGDKELEKGHKIIYPIYVDIYIDEGFIVARYKPKTNIYSCSENDIIYKENRLKPLDESIKIIEKIKKIFKAQSMDINPKQKFEKMMYGLYQKYSFTPMDIQNKIDSMATQRDIFVDEVFKCLELNDINRNEAKADLDIFLEKYISINGNMEKIFKEDRKAYLIKITSDDVLQMTRIDTSSTGNRPLQCSETFFDGKKSIINTKECKVLHLCYNRKKYI